MGSEQRKYKLYSSKALKNALDDVLAHAFAEKKYFRSRAFQIVLGLSKIVNATILFMIYLAKKPFEEKILPCCVFVGITLIFYLIEYGLSFVWWPNYYAIFSKDVAAESYIVCTSTGFYSGKYKISFHPTLTGSYLERLKPAILEEEFPLSDFFTESGYMLQDQWRDKCLHMISTVIANQKKTQ